MYYLLRYIRNELDRDWQYLAKRMDAGPYILAKEDIKKLNPKTNDAIAHEARQTFILCNFMKKTSPYYKKGTFVHVNALLSRRQSSPILPWEWIRDDRVSQLDLRICSQCLCQKDLDGKWVCKRYLLSALSLTSPYSVLVWFPWVWTISSPTPYFWRCIALVELSEAPVTWMAAVTFL